MATPKYAEALNNECWSYGIKQGDVRMILDVEFKENSPYIYTLETNSETGRTRLWGRNFKPIACPCKVSKCLKHRLENK